ncbi:MAG: glycoside hydrolase family 3 C-terminal domain-containing protein, partial [Oscillospiraceae bacterium]|nr:glycoside hydrolase family 3 C-terminal domain-containing protein [Oscillospiraceae bacterium]
ALGKPYIIVNVSGSSINFLPKEGVQKPAAVIQSFYPGAQGGRALAEILTGKISPSGKLPVTFYKSADLLPDFADYSMKNRTYRYLENSDNVLYPFGFGLTYGKFAVDNVRYAENSAVAEVKNIGKYDCEDVVQIYIKADCECAPKNPILCGFERVSLKAGESKTVNIPLSENAFTSVNEKGERGVFAKSFTLYAGTGNPDNSGENQSSCCISL